MSLPDLIQRELAGEDPVARVGLGGDDELFVSPTRTLIYRSEGLLSDESVEEYPHAAERVDVAESRRKAKLTLDYGLDGEESFTVPRDRLDAVLHPVLAGVLAAADVTTAGETVERTFRFSELTLVITSARLVKHIGAAVWDEEFEEFAFEDVTDLDFEEGSVATSVVLTVGGRQERFKAPAEEARAVREALTDAITAYYDVGSLEELRALSADAEGEPEAGGPAGTATGAGETGGAATVDFGDGPDPLSAEPAEVDDARNATRDDPLAEPAADASTGELPDDAIEREAGDAVPDDAAVSDAFEESGFEAATPTDDAAAELAALREVIEEQNERLARQEELVEQLIEELRRGR